MFLNLNVIGWNKNLIFFEWNPIKLSENRKLHFIIVVSGEMFV